MFLTPNHLRGCEEVKHFLWWVIVKWHAQRIAKELHQGKLQAAYKYHIQTVRKTKKHIPSTYWNLKVTPLKIHQNKKSHCIVDKLDMIGWSFRYYGLVESCNHNMILKWSQYLLRKGPLRRKHFMRCGEYPSMKFDDILLEVLYGFSITTSAGDIKNKKC